MIIWESLGTKKYLVVLRDICFCSSVVSITLQQREVDAVAVDGGQVYTAGKCGLVPVMQEQYQEGMLLRKHRNHPIQPNHVCFFQE